MSCGVNYGLNCDTWTAQVGGVINEGRGLCMCRSGGCVKSLFL